MKLENLILEKNIDKPNHPYNNPARPSKLPIKDSYEKKSPVGRIPLNENKK